MRVSPLSHPGLFVLSIPPDLLYLLPSVAVIEQHNQANVERKGLVCLMGFSLQRTVESQGTQGETREACLFSLLSCISHDYWLGWHYPKWPEPSPNSLLLMKMPHRPV